MEAMDTSRRNFLRTSSSALGVAWLSVNWPGIAAAAEHAHAAMVADPAERTRLRTLTAAQARDVEAIAGQIVPSGAAPGAHEAGVVYFIDHVHAGIFAQQSAAFLTGLQEFQRQCARHHAGTVQFADLPAGDQLAYLQHMQHTPFFGQMRFLTVLGLLSSPSYGGNADKVGWRLVGFVDRHVWESPYGHYDRNYPGFAPYPGTKVQS